MKKLFTILLGIALSTVFFGQEINLQQKLGLDSEKNMFSDTNQFDFKNLSFPNQNQPNKSEINYNFDAEKKLDSLIVNYNVDINLWTPTSKYEYSYDERGNLIVTVGNEWDSDLNKWEPEDKTEMLFNEFNNPHQELISIWKADSNQWFLYQKYEYEYDGNANLIMKKFIEKDYPTNNWVNKWKRDFTYAEFGMQSEQYSMWMPDSNMFIPYKLYEYTYNAMGKPDIYFEKVWIENTMS